MCIVAIADRVSDRFPLIVAANRDERHARPAAAADWWDGPGSLLAGRDLQAGGTWLGVTGSGRFAAVTNILEGGGERRAARSRGALVTGFLENSVTPSAFADSVDVDHYGPFNLVLRDPDELRFVSNRNAASSLAPGVHVFSNNAPGLQWTKVGALGNAIESAANRADITDFLIEALSGLIARGPLERAADSLFIVGEDFGTRCTTVLTVDATGQARFVEQRFSAAGRACGLSRFAFEFGA